MSKIRSIASMRDTLILAQKAEESEQPAALPLAGPAAEGSAQRRERARPAAE
jgi:hypothetical protein